MADDNTGAARDGRPSAAALAGHYPVVALVLQGGGALGSYQAGVFQGLDEAGICPNWVAGISIGALNAAIIAGNPPHDRVAQLRAFWESICRQPWWPPLPTLLPPADASSLPAAWRMMLDGLESSRALFEGQSGFFVPRPWAALGMGPREPDTASFYDTTPLRETLVRHADFARINRPDQMRVSVGAVNVRSGNFTYFDNTERTLRPEHFMASGALPPAFPAVAVDGEYYWDGGLVSNTPLQQVLSVHPRRDTLVFQIDLWSARGELPTDLLQVAERQKDIQYSSRTRMVTTTMREDQELRRLLHEALAHVPADVRAGAWHERAAALACAARRNVIHLIYRDKPYESYAKDFQFGQATMNEHWSSGLSDMRATLEQPQWLALPGDERPFVTHDVHGANRA